MTPQLTPAAKAELAPTGVLRAGINIANFLLVTSKDEKTGEPCGVAPDMARALAARLEVPVKLIPFDSPGKLADAAGSGIWEVGLLGAEPSRAEQIAFTAAYVEIEASYLVPPGSKLQSTEEVDRPGVRIAISARSAYDLYLSRNLKHATLVRAPTTEAAAALYQNDAGMAALAGVRQMLNDTQKARPGYRVLPDSYTRIEMAAGMPHGHEAGFRYLAAFFESVKASGFVRASLDRNGQTGAIVAPLVG